MNNETTRTEMIRISGIKQLVLVIWCLWLFTACSKNDAPTKPNNSAFKERVSFKSYKDTLVKIASINQQLGSDFDSDALGQPIGVMGTPFWLITVGSWYMNDRNILVQGSAFRIGNAFYPNPIRKVEVEFKGPFAGVIKYDSKTDQYDWLLESGIERSSFEYQRTATRHLLITERLENGLRLVDVASEKELLLNASSGNLIDWSLNEELEKVIFLIKPDTLSSLITQEFDLNMLLSYED